MGGSESADGVVCLFILICPKPLSPFFFISGYPACFQTIAVLFINLKIKKFDLKVFILSFALFHFCEDQNSWQIVFQVSPVSSIVLILRSW